MSQRATHEPVAIRPYDHTGAGGLKAWLEGGYLHLEAYPPAHEAPVASARARWTREIRMQWYSGYLAAYLMDGVSFVAPWGPISYDRVALYIGEAGERWTATEDIGAHNATAIDIEGEALFFTGGREVGRVRLISGPARPSLANIKSRTLTGVAPAEHLRQTVWMAGTPVVDAERPVALRQDPVLGYRIAYEFCELVADFEASGGSIHEREIAGLTNVFAGDLPHVATSGGDRPISWEMTAPAVVDRRWQPMCAGTLYESGEPVVVATEVRA